MFQVDENDNQRAIQALHGMEIKGEFGGIDQLANPEDVVLRILQSGLKIVDADLFDALVQAVRARHWAEGERRAMAWAGFGTRRSRYSEFIDAKGIARDAQARAIKALEESDG